MKKSNLEGYALLTGELPMDDAPVYVTDGTTHWEAMPTPAGFAAHLPCDAEGNLPALQLVYTREGTVLSSPIEANK